MGQLPRRELLRLMGLAGGGIAIGSVAAACGSGGGSGGRDIVLGVYGGPQEPVYRTHVADRLEAEDDANVTLALGTGGERVSKVYAERNQPSLDVAMLAIWDAVKGVEDGVLEEPDPSVPNVDQIHDFAVNGGYVASAFNLGLRYNPAKIDRPTSFEDLWNPEYAGHVAVPDPGKNANGIAFIAMLAQMYANDDLDNVDPVWDRLTALRDGLVLQYSSENDTNSLWDAQDIWIAVSSSSFAWQFKFEGSADVDFVTPTEGGALMGNVACIPVGANNPELARKAVGYMLDEPFQKEFAETHYFVPSREGVTVDAETQELLPDPSELVVLDYSTLARVRPDWSDRWTREMAG
ncbi:MAG: extracellular solute-binding protein [Micromonosporaceae bacterium]|nr:extracellular solute-binding protein [Micromonosporaceae bacterium]